jgi:hypothetical protein
MRQCNVLFEKPASGRSYKLLHGSGRQAS